MRLDKLSEAKIKKMMVSNCPLFWTYILKVSAREWEVLTQKFYNKYLTKNGKFQG